MDSVGEQAAENDSPLFNISNVSKSMAACMNPLHTTTLWMINWFISDFFRRELSTLDVP